MLFQFAGVVGAFQTASFDVHPLGHEAEESVQLLNSSVSIAQSGGSSEGEDKACLEVRPHVRGDASPTAPHDDVPFVVTVMLSCRGSV